MFIWEMSTLSNAAGSIRGPALSADLCMENDLLLGDVTVLGLSASIFTVGSVASSGAEPHPHCCDLGIAAVMPLHPHMRLGG